MDAELQTKLDDWLRWDENPETLAEIRKLADQNDHTTLRRLLCSRLSFGTAGLRGVMRAGFAAMNDLVIIQTAQGLCAHIRKTFPLATDQQRGICIGYDGRYNSKRFAQRTASVFLQAGIPVYLYGEMVATPFVPFAIGQLGCLAGVMVTASHNPKEDNGYKVYWANGAQIIAPNDKDIESSIREHLQPGPQAWDLRIVDESPMLHDRLAELLPAYNRLLCTTIPDEILRGNASSPLRFVYSAMHGVGYPYVRDSFEAAGLQAVVAVAEQRDADPDFPTVRFPNPEEGASALQLSMQLADRERIDVILANDPDADRLAFAERSAAGDWKVFSGNELGALLGWWSWRLFRQTRPNVKASECVMLSSTVSSMVLRSMAAVEGFRYEDTLTGFKWMGNRTVELAAEGRSVVFAFEEAIGFMCGTAVLDKDGVSAAVHLASLASWLQSDANAGGARTLSAKLEELYSEYGYHCSVNSYYICHDADVVARIFERIRHYDGGNDETSYPKIVGSGKYAIGAVRDLTTGYDSNQADGRAILPTSRSSQMITFSFENGVMMTLRTSGTEPKLKYYTEMCAKPEEKNWTSLRELLNKMVDDVVNELFQPALNGLIARDA